jgi:hypothetical protein
MATRSTHGALLAIQCDTQIPPEITLPATTSSGLNITYTVVSGPAHVSGNTLTLTGTGQVTLTAVQPGNNSYASISDIETLTVIAPVADTPAMPFWRLATLTALLALVGARSLHKINLHQAIK